MRKFLELVTLRRKCEINLRVLHLPLFPYMSNLDFDYDLKRFNKSFKINKEITRKTKPTVQDKCAFINIDFGVDGNLI